MAIDKSEPRMGIIVGLSVLAVVTIVSLRFVLQSYYSIMLDGEEDRKITGVEPAMLRSIRQDEQRRMEAAPMTIDRAMDMYAHGRPAAIAPQASTDTAAMVGWSQRPRVFVSGTPQGVPSTQLQGAPAQTGAGTTGGPTAPSIPNVPGTAGPIGAPGALPANGAPSAPAPAAPNGNAPGAPTAAPPSNNAPTDATQSRTGAQAPAAPAQGTQGGSQGGGDHPAQGAVQNQQQQGARP